MTDHIDPRGNEPADYPLLAGKRYGEASLFQPENLARRLSNAFIGLPEPVLVGPSWTTDAPYRETRTAIDSAVTAGIVCVEMEAAGLYAYATARSRHVVCLAHITNTMATSGDDFDKGDDNGVAASLAVAHAVAAALQDPQTNAG